jgi:hypothetical protein
MFEPVTFLPVKNYNTICYALLSRVSQEWILKVSLTYPNTILTL